MLVKKLSFVLLAFSLSSSVFANGTEVSAASNGNEQAAVTSSSSAGAYIGVMGGLGLIDEGNGFSKFASSVRDLNFIPAPIIGTITFDRARKNERGYLGVRGFIGLMANRYLGFEFGYSYYQQSKYSGKYHADAYCGNQLIFGYTQSGDANMRGKIQTQVLDLVAKGVLPVGSWSFYAKAGAAYVISKLSLFTSSAVTGSGGAPAVTSPVPTISDHNFNRGLAPTYGAGVAYHFNDHVSLDLSYMGFLGRDKLKFDNNNYVVKNLHKAIPTGNLVGLAVTYYY